MDLLNDKLKQIVDAEVKHYKDDLLMDIEVLLDKHKLSDTFIFIVRENGTHLYEKNKLFVTNSNEREDYLHWSKSATKAYEVIVSKRCLKNVYGSVSELNLENLTKAIINDSKFCNTMTLKILMHDDSELVLDVSTDVKASEILEENKILISDVKKIYNLKYFNK